MKWILIAVVILFLAACTQVTMELKITSPAFVNNGKLPAKYTCDGQGVNPSLDIEGIPKEANSLVLIVDDPDAVSGTFVHWVVFDIPAKNIIEENSTPGTEGVNSAKRHGYVGPCPPSGTHRYFFKAYALNSTLNISENSTKADVEKAMKGKILASGQIIGLYARNLGKV